jgi:large exoprotein involved in heme utilization and adhesion
MASFAFNSNASAPQTLVNDEDGFIGQNGSLFVSGASAITAAGSNTVTVLGSVYSTGSGRCH